MVLNCSRPSESRPLSHVNFSTSRPQAASRTKYCLQQPLIDHLDSMAAQVSQQQQRCTFELPICCTTAQWLDVCAMRQKVHATLCQQPYYSGKTGSVAILWARRDNAYSLYSATAVVSLMYNPNADCLPARFIKSVMKVLWDALAHAAASVALRLTVLLAYCSQL